MADGYSQIYGNSIVAFFNFWRYEKSFSCCFGDCRNSIDTNFWFITY